MRLSLLLFILSLKLRDAALRNRAFKNYIGTVRLNILIRTRDGKSGRLFVFDKGSVSSVKGAGHACDAALVWSDSGTAFRVMIKGTDEASFQAAAAGMLTVEGMSYYIQWFNDAVKLVM